MRDSCVQCTMQDDETPALTKRAALLIVGDEILSGKVADLNSRLLCKELFLLGWRVCKVNNCSSAHIVSAFVCVSGTIWITFDAREEVMKQRQAVKQMSIF